jgi:endo-1,4-beta-xylanase
LAILLIACRPLRSDPPSGTGGHQGSGGSGGNGGSVTGGTFAMGGSSATGGSSGSGGGATFGGTTGSAGGAGSGGDAAGGVVAGGSAAGGKLGTGGVACTATSVPSSFAWSTGASLMDPVSDNSSHHLVAIKDPSLVYYSGRYHVYATVVDMAGNSNMTYSSFVDFASAGSATAYYMDYTSGFSGTRYSPQLFYMSAQKKWYLITQSSGPSYSTATDPGQASTWTKPSAFFSSTPNVVTQNAGSGAIAWSDFWVICDGANCHLFFSNQNNVLFRSQTSVGNFPNGFGTPAIVMQGSESNSLFAVSGVYRVTGTGKFLLLVEAVGSKGHFIRSWTADALDGSWKALTDTETNPFAGAANVTFSDVKWTGDISQGELVRSGYDETAAVNPCAMQFIFEGRDPHSSASPELLPWKLGLLTKNN